MIVAKAVNMANMMNIPVLGVVENMSYLECPDCGKRIEVFGHSNLDEVAAEKDSIFWRGCRSIRSLPACAMLDELRF